MSQIAMITIEGPLSHGDDIRTAPPQKWAKPLYEAIHSQFRTFALSRCPDVDMVRWWLRKEGLGDWSGVLCWNQAMSYEDWRIDTVREFLSNAWEIAFLLDAVSDVTTVVQSMGVLTLTIGAPLIHPGWKPDDHQFRSWDDVVSTVEPRL